MNTPAADIQFVRRTARCLFDANGQKYLIDPWIKTAAGLRIEHVKP